MKIYCCLRPSFLGIFCYSLGLLWSGGGKGFIDDKIGQIFKYHDVLKKEITDDWDSIEFSY